MIDVDDEQRRRWIAGAAAAEGIVRGVEERTPNEHAGEVIHFARRVRRRRGGLLRWGCRGIREAASQWPQAAHDGLEHQLADRAGIGVHPARLDAEQAEWRRQWAA